ncbi:MAG: FliA/WhiG family RNA polymerase sigma factor [Planctomycetota bacterium]
MKNTTSGSPGRDHGEIGAVWSEFKKKGDERLRNVLIERYMPLVKYIAARIAARLPANLEVDDLISAGVFGLIDAIEGFDMGRHVKFETYCVGRIRGSILDELRSMDWVPRLIRTRAHQIDEAYKRLEMEIGREPTDQEMARRLGVSLQKFEDIVRETNTATMVSISQDWEESDSDQELKRSDILADKRDPGPVVDIERREIRDWVVHQISAQERMVVLLYYFDELTMKEIGDVLGISESRVCQIHAKIMLRLRHRMSKQRSASDE